MKWLSIVLALGVSGCCNSTSSSKLFYRHDDTVCHYASRLYCGVRLSQCDNGAVYECVTNVKEERK